MNFKLTEIECEMPVLIPGLKWNEAEHPRDESGRFGQGSGGKKPVQIHENSEEEDDYRALNASVYYHGTSQTAWKDIGINGLIAGKGKATHGADEWAKRNGLHTEQWGTKDRKFSVFLTSEIDVAIRYAKVAAEITGTNPVLLRIDRDAMLRDKMKLDEQSDNSSIRYTGKIGSQYIANISGAIKNENKIKPLYVFFLVKKK